MADQFDPCLGFTLAQEGGYVDDPADPGGATNMGITLATLRHWDHDPALGPVDVRDMTRRPRQRSTARSTGTHCRLTLCQPASISVPSTSG